MKVFECPFSLQARKSSNSIALATLEKSWTYLQCHELIEGIAKALKAEGVKPEDRVALFPTKDFPTPLLFFALFRVGAICCPLNIYLPKESIPQTLGALGATFFLIPDAKLVKTTVYPDKLKNWHLGNAKASGFNGRKWPHIINIGPLPTVKSRELSRYPNANSSACLGIKTSQSFLDKEAHATYLFTSGTTAQPKIACHSLGNHYYSALGSNARMALKPGDHYLLSLPLYHIAGIAILFRTFLAGATVLLSEKIEHPRATHLSLVPTQLYRLLKNPVHGHLKHILLGGSNISYNLYKEALQNGLPVHPSYGMTEMSSQIATHFEARSFSLGHPLPFREMKIADDGEIYVRGKTLFQGYFDQAKGLELPLNDEGWFCTHDLGVYSPKTGLQVIGRKDRLFISGGENIQPEEIEKILENIEGIESAEVVPIPDDEFGFRPVAYIKSEKGYSEEKLKAFLASILPKFKIPISFYPSRKP